MENKENNEVKVATTADRLREAMQNKKMNAATLSRISEMSEASIFRYMNGNTVPKHATMLLLAAALDVSDAWLYGYDVPMDRPDPFKQGEHLYTMRALSEQEKQREDGNTFPDEKRALQGGGLSVTELGLIEEFRKLTVADQVEVLALCLKLAKKEASER